MATNYDAVYRSGKNALGPPSGWIVKFFEELALSNASVLDIGCGQGRDALFIARLGHRVTGVDLSPVAIADLQEASDKEALNITAVVGDITKYAPRETVDVLLFDRTLHMLDEPERGATLARFLGFIRPGGFVVIADEKSNMAGFDPVLKNSGHLWTETHRKAGGLILKSKT